MIAPLYKISQQDYMIYALYIWYQHTSYQGLGRNTNIGSNNLIWLFLKLYFVHNTHALRDEPMCSSYSITAKVSKGPDFNIQLQFYNIFIENFI